MPSQAFINTTLIIILIVIHDLAGFITGILYAKVQAGFTLLKH